MIGELTLEALCKQYGIDANKVIGNNQNVLEYGEYLEIKKVLDYLVKELGIYSKNIEKCPSILYLNVNAIKYNYEFLRCHKININNVETCLHILSTNPQELQKTYSYVLNNYGEKYLNSITSILSVPTGRIEQVEKLFNSDDKNIILSASVSRRTVDEIKEIIKVCKENNIEITGSVFKRQASEIKEIIKVCKENNIEIAGTVFLKHASEIEKIIKLCKENNIEITRSIFLKQASEIEEIIKVCKENNIEITGNVFKKQASEIEEIIKVCKENNIEITGSVFLKNAKQLQKNIDYIKSNFDSRYLMPLIVSKNLKQLQEIMTYLNEKGVLEVLITSASILTLTLEEVRERENFILSIGENITSNGKFNSIFGLSRKNYQLKKEKYSAIK